jgi:hypothetical protein
MPGDDVNLEAWMPEPLPLSRRTFLSAGATLLASIGAGAALPGATALAKTTDNPAAGNPGADGTTPGRTDLALYRPVRASSTDYAPTPADFAVDGLAQPGVRGSGWRAAAAATGPQWISVDLEAPCRVEAVALTFEAVAADPPFNGNYGETDGTEIRSSAATAFTLETSSDGEAWRTAHTETNGAGGTAVITLVEPITARWVRLSVTRRSNSNPVGLNGFQVYGTPTAPRPTAHGWTDWAGGNTHPAPALAVAADGTAPLESGWSLTLDDFVSEPPTGTDVDIRDWLPAVVPGTVLATLVEHGHLPDPVAGFANLHIPEALSRHSWWYRRVLRLPRGLDTSPGRHLWLEFDGVNHAATAWVNGTEAGTVTHPFARAAFDITEATTGKSRHVITVKVTPMPHPGTPGDKGPDGNTFVQSGHLHLDSPTYLAASGWDWMPAVRDRVAGLWDHVRLRSTGAAVLGDPHVTTTVGAGTATVTIAVPVRNAGAVSQKITVRARFEDTELSRTVTVAAGQSVTATFDPVTVRKPRLWWPNGYGDPSLYDLTLTASVNGKQSDERATRFGIREFTYDWNAPVVISPPPQPPLVFDGGTAIQTVTFPRRSARSVRIQAGRRATGWGVSMWTLAVRDGENGSDLALGKTATASGDDGNPATNAVDGNPDTRWSSRYQDGEWIQVDLGESTAFDRVTIAWESAYALDFRVQAGDGDTWTDVEQVSNETPIGDTGVQTETFPGQTTRYVRVVGDRRATEWGISLWTLEVKNGENGIDLARGKAATASGDDGNPATNAVDGNPRTRWSSRYQDGEWIQIDLGAPTAFDRVGIAWEQAYARAYRIQVSDDGRAWTDVTTVDNSIRQLKISVNGVPVFVRGGNWGWDELLRRVPGHRTAETVAMHRDMNFTMIRNWLGSSNREEFYRACDENGLLVWNDFWQAGGFQPNPPGYVDLAAETIRRFRVHPSIVVWCGANEAFPPPIVDAGLKQAVETENPEVLYVQNSAGWIVSGHGPYRWVDPATYNDRNTYDTQAFGFHTEIGMPVIPHVETMLNLAGDEPGWPIGAVWNYHDWSERGNQRTDTYRAAIDARLGESGSLAEFAARAQFVNYESHRAMFEAWNANLWDDATALLLWMSHPAWYSTVWQTYDYDLDVNGAYYGSRKACEPRHVQADPATWRVRALNHTTSPLSGEVVARCYDLSGRQLGATQRQHVEVGPSAGEPAFPLTAPAGHPLHLVRLELRDVSNHLLSESTYWRYEKDTDMRALTTMARTRLTVTSIGGSGTRLTVTVTNRGSTVAAMVRLALRDGDGDRVLPARYDDNYFWLLPGESRRVAVTWPSRLNGCRGVHVTAEAYNAARVAG